MNTDRFLTRVFDKQEKKMLDQGNAFQIQVDGHVTCYNVLGVTPQGITFDCFTVDGDNAHYTSKDYDRFIPMQCTGFCEDNVKDGNAAYEFDIIKTHVGVYLLVKLRQGCWIAEDLEKKYSVDLASLEGRFSRCGNKFEHEDLLND